jgi:diguanylate cyclase (GGDEF)-like protein
LLEQLRQTARLAETDALTGLANRARLMRVLARMQSDGQNGRGVIDDRGQVFGLLHLDLDYFKQINDRLGHAVGDAVLKQAAARMRSVLGPRDVAARVGGDEFVVLSRSDPKGVELQKLGQRLLNRLRQPMEAEGHALEVTASIGGAVATSARRDGEALIADADIALYEVKRAGRAGVRVFDETMRAASLARDALLDALRKYGTDDAFVPHFQPLVSLRTGLFSGFELLARWNHPERGPLNPAEFMDLVEEAGLTQQLDHTVRRKGLEALRDLREAGWAAPRMSFNASLPTLQDPNIVTRLMFELSALDLSPQDLAIELREDDIASLGLDLAEQQLQALRKAGFRVELDDYGAAGSASLELLATLPISALKLDASMAQILNAPRAGAVLGALVTMADALERPVVAKGVETPEQFARLRGLGCAHAQGHGISPPLPLEELVGFMSGYGQAPVNLAQLA